MRKWHLSQDLKKVRELPSDSWRQRKLSAERSRAGAGLACSSNSPNGLCGCNEVSKASTLAEEARELMRAESYRALGVILRTLVFIQSEAESNCLVFGERGDIQFTFLKDCSDYWVRILGGWSKKRIKETSQNKFERGDDSLWHREAVSVWEEERSWKWHQRFRTEARKEGVAIRCDGEGYKPSKWCVCAEVCARARALVWCTSTQKFKIAVLDIVVGKAVPVVEYVRDRRDEKEHRFGSQRHISYLMPRNWTRLTVWITTDGKAKNAKGRATSAFRAWSDEGERYSRVGKGARSGGGKACACACARVKATRHERIQEDGAMHCCTCRG